MSYAPGNYICTCCHCGEVFTGDKRSVTCFKCFIDEFNKLQQDKARLVEALKEAEEEIHRMVNWTTSCYYDKKVMDKISALIEEMEGGQDDTE